MKIRQCTTCGMQKDDTDFYARARRIRSQCIECEKDYARKRHAQNKEAMNLKSKDWSRKNPERKKALFRSWREDNAAYHRGLCRSHYHNNREMYYAIGAKRRAAARLATPQFADMEAIKDIYLEARYQQMEVDHIVPLRSKLVCGLNWEGNLQLLTREENTKKNNRVWPDMP